METIILIPAYNEEKNIKEVTTRVKKSGFFPIVIDDGSNDRTAEVAEKSGTTVVRHEKNKGKGEAMTTGFKLIAEKYPEVKYVVILDADLQYDPEDIPRIVEPLKKNEADFITGYRNWKEVPGRHSLGNFVWRNTFNLFFGTKLKDTNCGFIAMTTEAMKKMMKITYGGYIIENMMLAEALKNNFRIKQVPVKVHYHYIRSIPGGSRIVLGCWIFIIKRALRQRFRIKL